MAPPRSLGGLPVVLNPMERDVRLGRGRGCSSHFGNTLLEDVIKSYSAQYANAAKTIGVKGKKLVSTSIVHAIHRNGGRFIKWCPTNEVWFEVPDAVARVKVAQALKYRCRKLNLRSSEDDSIPGEMYSQTSLPTTAAAQASSSSAPPKNSEHHRAISLVPFGMPQPPGTPLTTRSLRKPFSPTFSSPLCKTATSVAAVTPYTPKRVVDFRYFGTVSPNIRDHRSLSHPPLFVPSSRMSEEVDHVYTVSMPPSHPIRTPKSEEDEEISLTSVGNDTYVAESMTMLIPPLLSDRSWQRSTALSAKVLHDDEAEEYHDPLPLLESK